MSDARKTHQPTIRKRIETKIKKTVSGCWMWQGATTTTKAGTMFGIMCIQHHNELAHRVAIREYTGAKLVGIRLKPVCGHTLCVNPDHWK